VGRPAAAKKSNAEQYFFVNGRYFSDQYLRKAVLKAYEKLIPDTCFPSYFLFLTIDPEADRRQCPSPENRGEVRRQGGRVGDYPRRRAQHAGQDRAPCR